MTHKDTNEETLDKILRTLFHSYGPHSETLAIESSKQQILTYIDSVCQSKCIEAEKRGFYAGQANAGVELYDCHDNYKKWFGELSTKGQKE